MPPFLAEAGLFVLVGGVVFAVIVYRKRLALFLLLSLLFFYLAAHAVSLLQWPLRVQTGGDLVPWAVNVFGDLFRFLSVNRIAIIVGLMAGISFRQFSRNSSPRPAKKESRLS